ncbi:MAG: hypothetical protein F6K62_06840 [Sphaerospermopsis sp. SIO1G2]|nr:hypothetical protein [Sphaerospermopsis sp. SIO1G2]
MPEQLTDAANQLAQNCGGTSKKNTFTSIGRGGLPYNPSDLLTGIKPLVGFVDTVNLNTKINSNIKSTVRNNELNNHENPIIQEAQGWITTSNGRVILTTKSMQVNPHTPVMRKQGAECGV